MSESVAIVKQIDHFLIACRDPQALFTLFAETFRLPVTWDMKQLGSFTSGGLFCGNVDLEFLKLNDTDDFTALHGIAFEPTPLETSIPELAARGIPAQASIPFEGTLPDGEHGVLWRNVMLPWFLGDNMIFLCDRAPYAHERRARLASAFDGGALGIQFVQQIVVGNTALPHVCQKWQDLFAPTPIQPPAFWQLGGGPALALVPHNENRLLRLVIAVESLAHARDFLAAHHLLAGATDTELIIAPAALDGLDIRLVAATA